MSTTAWWGAGCRPSAKLFRSSDRVYWEVVVFGDVGVNTTKYIVHTWHRTARIEDGKVTKVAYGQSYPAFPPARKDPQPEEFYSALLDFAEYWDRQLHEMAPVTLPDRVWVDLTKHAFAKELMTRPGGIYPKYGAVDRDYGGSEYDAFQDIFTSAIYTNMEWGRLETAKLYIDNYFTDFVDSKGMIDMRGPETAQFGMTLSLLARYFNYSGDTSLLLKHRAKIEATAKLSGRHARRKSEPAARPCRIRIDPRMERIRLVPDGGSVAVLAGILRQQRFRGSRFQRHRQDLDGTRTQPTRGRHGETRGRLVETQPDPAPPYG